MHWAAKYIGIPWEKGAQGPDSFDCWALARHVQGERFGRHLPIIVMDADDPSSVGVALNTHPERANWRRTKSPQEGDLVVMQGGANPDHVGIWIEAESGGVIHCLRGSGVVFTKSSDLQAQGWGLIRVWRHKDAA